MNKMLHCQRNPSTVTSPVAIISGAVSHPRTRLSVRDCTNQPRLYALRTRNIYGYL